MPLGVEVTLAADPITEDATPEDLDGLVFRRVIYLPASRPISSSSVTDTNAPAGEAMEGLP
jgi:hypothetical protein